MRNRSHSESVAESVSVKMSHKGGQDVTLFITGKIKWGSKAGMGERKLKKLSMPVSPRLFMVRSKRGTQHDYMTKVLNHTF